MVLSFSAVALVVHGYDEAVHFFAHALRLPYVEGVPLSVGKRRVTVRPPGGGTALLLAKAATPVQSSRVGDQSGGAGGPVPPDRRFRPPRTARPGREQRDTVGVGRPLRH